jgi:hypothetical protein
MSPLFAHQADCLVLSALVSIIVGLAISVAWKLPLPWWGRALAAVGLSLASVATLVLLIALGNLMGWLGRRRYKRPDSSAQDTAESKGDFHG